MKSYRGISCRFLIRQYKKTILMICAVALSICLMTTTGILIDSFKEANLKAITNSRGSHEVGFRFVTDNNIKSLRNNKIVKSVGIVSFPARGRVESIKENLKIMGYDKIGAKLHNLVIEKGRYPEKENEIALEDTFVKRNGLEGKFGQRINLGYSCDYVGADNESLLVFDAKKSYILTAIIKEREISKTWGAQAYVSLSGGNRINPYGNKYITALVKLKSDEDIDGNVEKIKEEVGFPFYTMTEKNTDLQRGIKVIKGMAIFNNIILLIIILASMAAIYNIFSISIAERTRIFGLLRSIGAEREQIGTLILFEGFIIGITGIMLGLATGTVLPEVIIHFIGRIKGVVIDIVRDAAVYVKVAELGIVAVLLASWAPMRLGRRVAPIEAIKGSIGKSSNTKVRRSFLSFILYKFFGIQGKMAGISITSNKKRFLATLFSIAISMMIFTIISYFVATSDPIRNLEQMMGGDLSIETQSDNIKDGISTVQLKAINESGYVKSAKGIIRYYGEARIDESLVDEKIKKYLVSSSDWARNFMKRGICPISMDIIALKDEELKKLSTDLSDGKIKLQDMTNNPTILLMQSISGKNMTSLKADDEFKLHISYAADKGFEEINMGFKVGGILNHVPVKGNFFPEEMIGVVSETYIRKLLPQSLYKRVDVVLKEGKDEEKVKRLLEELSVKVRNSSVMSFKEAKKQIKEKSIAIYTILYGFVATVALIGIMSLINTITINIITKRKEIGLLRAVGMTSIQLKHMLYIEGAFYGVLGTIIGTVIGMFISYLIYDFLHWRISGLEWIIPYKLILGGIFTTIAVIFTAIIIPYRKISRDTIVESLGKIE